MGRFGPLTSLALGRSPYDDVVPGEGEPDTRGPQQLYDERGRPINPETRRINREVIRSHNEVMLVIGVAEPENESPDMKIVAAKKRNQYEELMGARLFRVSGILEAAGVWGVNGMRQRILLYKQYAAVPFRDLYRLNRSHQSVPSYFFSGLPSFLASNVIEQISLPEVLLSLSGSIQGTIKRLNVPIVDIIRKFYSGHTNHDTKPATKHKAINYLRPIFRGLTLYVGLHLDIFTFMQRVGIPSPTTILPNWKFYVPGSSLSPIYVPPFPSQVTPRSIIGWLGGFVMGVAPVAGFFVFTRFSRIVTLTVCRLVLAHLPYPDVPHEDEDSQDAASSPTANTATGPRSAGTSADGGPRNGRDLARDEPTHQVLEGQPQNEALPVGTSRRQSAVSVRGDEFASDDEETEIVRATLISFDVEGPESTDTTPGVWSAELCPPNLADNKALANKRPKFREASLYRLPPILAADVIGVPLARVLLAPLESLTWLGLARQLLRRNGGALESLHPLGMWGFLQPFSWGRMVNVVGLEMVFLVMQGEVWGLMMMAAQLCQHTDEEWEERLAEENAARHENQEHEETETSGGCTLC